MKTVLRTIVVLAVLVSMVFSMGCTATETCLTDATVVETYDDVVIVETPDGNQWAFYGDGFEYAARVTIAIQDGEIIDATVIE